MHVCLVERIKTAQSVPSGALRDAIARETTNGIHICEIYTHTTT